MVYISPPNYFTLHDSFNFLTEHKYNRSLNTTEGESFKGKRILE